MVSPPCHWRPEHQWICRLARSNVPASTIADLTGATASLDWDALLATSDVHGVTEHLAAPIAMARRSVASHVFERVERRVIEVTALNLSRAAQLVGLMERLRAHGIRALAFKGPALAQALYGQLGRRPSTDLDILVDRRHAARVRPVLMADGYTLPPRRRHRGGSLIHGLYPAAGRDDTLLPASPQLAAVDVHVGFAFWTQGIRLDARSQFDRSVTIPLLDASIPTLCMDDLLLVLSIHGMMHGWCALRLLTDIDGVAAHVLDWDAVVARAQSANMLRVLLVALLLAHALLGTTLPPTVLVRARSDEAAVHIASGVATRLFDPPAAGGEAWDPRPWFLSFQDDARARLRFHARDLVYEWFLKWPWDEWRGRRRSPGAAG